MAKLIYGGLSKEKKKMEKELAGHYSVEAIRYVFDSVNAPQNVRPVT